MVSIVFYNMKVMFTIIALALSMGLPVVYAEQQSSVYTPNECIFTANIEKSWVFFTERPWVIGSVVNCDDGILYHQVDSVYVRILDINGDVIDDHWKANHDTARTEFDKPTKYIFNDNVYRGGGIGMNADVSGLKTIHIKPNQYFFYMPQINSVDFDSMGVYTIELTYGNYIRTINFAVLNPYGIEDEPCSDVKENRILYQSNQKYYLKMLEEAELYNNGKRDMKIEQAKSYKVEKIDNFGGCL